MNMDKEIELNDKIQPLMALHLEMEGWMHSALNEGDTTFAHAVQVQCENIQSVVMFLTRGFNNTWEEYYTAFKEKEGE